MLNKFGLFGLVSVAVFGLSASMTSASVLNSISINGANDCSGYYGQGFDNCNVKYEDSNGNTTTDLSAVIAKWGNDDWVDNSSTLDGSNTESDINNTVWNAPGAGGSGFALDGSEFSIIQNTDDTWTWSYTPGTNDPLVKYWVHKQGNAFDLYWETASACTTVDSLACLQQAVNVSTGTWDGDWSHITWYNTTPSGGTGPQPVPLPAAGFLLLGALGALGAFKRFRRVAG